MRILSLTAFAVLLSAPAFAADLGTYRPGTPYHSAVSDRADVCDSHCAGDAQCRGWNYVKPNPQAPGICEYLSSVSAPISSQISISGESQSAVSFSSRVTAGGTNTIRVGTPSPIRTKSVAVGQTPASRRVVREAVPQRVSAAGVSQQALENMSLTEQQNRFRQGQVALRNTAPGNTAPGNAAPQQPTLQRANYQNPSMQRPAFRPILDAPSAARAGHPQRQIDQRQISQRQSGRRVTGPRRSAPSRQLPYQGAIQAQQPAPYQAPQAPNPYQNYAAAQAQVSAKGSPRPPVGVPIQAPQPPVRASAPQVPQPSTPSQRLARLTAQTPATPDTLSANGPIALTPQQAQKSLFGRLNDDLGTQADMPVVSAVPTAPVIEQELGAVLAGGL